MALRNQNTAIRRASKLLDVTYIVSMEVVEARQKTDAIRGRLVEAAELLLEMHERQGWKALGYTSWREWAQAELDLSKTRGYQLLDFGRVRRNVKQLEAGNSTIVEKLNEGVARELARVSPELQAEVIKRAVAEYRNDFPSATQVSAIVRKYYPPAPNGKTRAAPKPVGGGKKQQQARARLAQWAREAPYEAVERVMRDIEREGVE